LRSRLGEKGNTKLAYSTFCETCHDVGLTLTTRRPLSLGLSRREAVRLGRLTVE
jgi:hypothetical protein